MILLVWDRRLDVPSASRAMKRTLEISSGLESAMVVVRIEWQKMATISRRRRDAERCR